MIIINGKVFRNLEEQVAYLSEMIPLFTTEDGQLIIKQGDGTEIARITLDAVSNMNVSTANDITTITITKADSTTQTFTIDMTGYLKKNTTTTAQDYAYIKKADGTQDILVIDDQLRNLSLVKRNANGGINCSAPVFPNNAATKQYVDDAVAGASGYTHIVEATFVDSCDEEFIGRFIMKLPSNTPLTMATFKALFTYGDSAQYKQIPYVSMQQFDSDNNGLITSVFDYDSNNDEFRNSFAYSMGGYSSSLTLQSLTDTIV